MEGRINNSICISEHLERFVAEHRAVDPAAVRVTVKQLRGGLVSPQVVEATAHITDPPGRRQILGMVAKYLEGETIRESAIYRRVVERAVPQMAPQLMGVRPLRPGSDVLLVLERVRRVRAWPWRDLEVSAAATRRLAELHELLHEVPVSELPSWDYDAELAEAAEKTLAVVESLPAEPDLREPRACAPALRRLVASLPSIRRHLLEDMPLAPAVIHGDLHPGNTIVRRRHNRPDPVFLDWGRARCGSPLEDVNSWLHSLGHWEPSVAKARERLLRSYLKARGLPARLTPLIRRGYWLAGACNALSGALTYHIVSAQAATTPHQRATHLGAAGSWLRAVRQADRCCKAIQPT